MVCGTSVPVSALLNTLKAASMDLASLSDPLGTTGFMHLYNWQWTKQANLNADFACWHYIEKASWALVDNFRFYATLNAVCRAAQNFFWRGIINGLEKGSKQLVNSIIIKSSRQYSDELVNFLFCFSGILNMIAIGIRYLIKCHI